MRLVQYDDDFEILIGDEQLMGNWATASERALATMVCEKLGARAERLLIGGLGMGFTLAAAIDAAPKNTIIEVAELVPGVIEWARGPLAHVFKDTLTDPRVQITVRDVHDVVADREDWFDAILLDVDNGPDGLVMLANERLYSNWGLATSHRALRRGGILAIWSAQQDVSFPARLHRAGFAVEERQIDSGEGEDRQLHTIWLACK